jgi:hypothetical protein
MRHRTPPIEKPGLAFTDAASALLERLPSGRTSFSPSGLRSYALITGRPPAPPRHRTCVKMLLMISWTLYINDLLWSGPAINMIDRSGLWL